MKSLICGATAAALLVAVGLFSRVDAAADESVGVDVVMKKLFAGKTAPNNTLKAAAKTASPDWSKVKEASELFAKYAPELGKNEPPRGEKDSWSKLCKQLADEAKALESAVEGQDVEKFQAAVKNIGGSCKSCHEAHRPE